MSAPRKKKGRARPANQARAASRKKRGARGGGAARSSPGPACKLPASAAELARAIFERNDAVEIASDLLQEAGDTTAAKIYTLLLEYVYGRPLQAEAAEDAEGGDVPCVYVSSIPRPPAQEPVPGKRI